MDPKCLFSNTSCSFAGSNENRYVLCIVFTYAKKVIKRSMLFDIRQKKMYSGLHKIKLR